MYPFQIEVLPAYGRDYKNKKEIFEAYSKNQDFEVSDISNKGKINKTDCLRYGIACLIVRYRNNQRLASINVIKNRMN
tara:strand:+ start:1137 stop:1370 length:234 start_codon:yes stop_codon:yes gene_type:complete